jgi:putative hydrolase of the HAD superfamily
MNPGSSTPHSSSCRAILFDLDDTLYRERDFVFSGFRAVGEWSERVLGIDARACEHELAGLFERGVLGTTFNEWLTHRNLSLEHVPAMVRTYQEHTPVISLDVECEELLGRLRQQYRLGVVTDGFLHVQQRKAAALKLDQHVDVVVFSDRWGRSAWKPNPKALIAALDALACSAADSIYVGDNPTKDFIAARRAGMRSVRLRRRAGIHAALESRGVEFAADFEISCLSQLEVCLVVR